MTDPAPPRRNRRPLLARMLLRWVRLMTLLLAGAMLAGRFSSAGWQFDMLSHFQLQYFVCAIVLLALLLCMKSWKWAALGLLCAIASGVNVAPWYFSAGSSSPPPHAAPLRVMLFNVWQWNQRRDDVVAHVRAVDPDIIVLQEINDPWFAALRPLRETLPHAHHEPGGVPRGMAIFSRLPLLDVQRIDFGNPLSPSVSLAIEVAGRRVSILATHPWPPVSDEAFRSRNHQLRQLGDFMPTLPRPAILIGDLNTAMWSATYAELDRRTRLRNTRKGFGILPSHPMNRSPLLRVPIDHIFVSDEFIVRDCRLGEPCGSDHAPVIVELSLTHQARGAD